MSNLEFAKVMQGRTKAFAVQIIKFYGEMPRTEEARVMGRQLLRAATSVAANYRAVCRSKSYADFIHKLGTVVEEVDETLLWLELLEGAGLVAEPNLASLKSDAGELLRVLQTSLNTAKSNRAANTRARKSS